MAERNGSSKWIDLCILQSKDLAATTIVSTK